MGMNCYANKVESLYETWTQRKANTGAILAESKASRGRRVLALAWGNDRERLWRLHGPQGSIKRSASGLMGTPSWPSGALRTSRYALMRQPAMLQSCAPFCGYSAGQHDRQVTQGSQPWQQKARPPAVTTLGSTSGCAAGFGTHVQADRSGSRRGTCDSLATTRKAVTALDPRNADLVDARRAEVARALFGTAPELPGQEALDLFGAAS